MCFVFAERRLFRLGVLTLALLCIIQATLNLSLRLACKFCHKKSNLAQIQNIITARRVVPKKKKKEKKKHFATIFHPIFRFCFSALKSRCRLVCFQQLGCGLLPEWAAAAEFNPGLFLLQRPAQAAERESWAEKRTGPLMGEDPTAWQGYDDWWWLLWIWGHVLSS